MKLKASQEFRLIVYTNLYNTNSKLLTFLFEFYIDLKCCPRSTRELYLLCKKHFPYKSNYIKKKVVYTFQTNKYSTYIPKA